MENENAIKMKMETRMVSYDGSYVKELKKTFFAGSEMINLLGEKEILEETFSRISYQAEGCQVTEIHLATKFENPL